MSQAARSQARRREFWLFVAVVTLELIVLGTFAARRNVNPDEGFYVVAGWRLLAGKRLYHDFFYPQMPYLPYVEAGVLAFAGSSLLVMRWISVVSGALVAGVLAATASRRTESLASGMVVAVACIANSLFANYLSIVKTYGLSNLGLVVAFLAIALPTKPRRMVGLIAGLAAGFAVGVRLPAAAAVVVLAWLAWRRGARFVVAFGAGVLVASVPWLLSVWDSPDPFWFSNFGFHSLRREISGFVPVMTQKLVVLAKWTLLPQSLLLWIGAFAGVWYSAAWALPAIACAAALAVVYLAATPTYLDYLVQIIPFLLLASIPALPVLLKRRFVAVSVLSIYLLGLAVALRTAPEESRRGAKVQLWNVANVERVAEYLRANSEPGDSILSWWEGYPFLAGRDGYLGVGFWESNASRKLSPQLRSRYHILHRDDLRQLISASAPRLVVFPRGVWEDLEADLTPGYELVQEFGKLRVFARRGDLG